MDFENVRLGEHVEKALKEVKAALLRNAHKGEELPSFRNCIGILTEEVIENEEAYTDYLLNEKSLESRNRLIEESADVALSALLLIAALKTEEK